MASKNPRIAVPRCFKHNKTWQPRIQQLLNKIRDSLLPKIYIGRFNNLLCICEDGPVAGRPDIAQAWDDVTDSHLSQSVSYIDNYIASNIGNANVPILKKLMEWLRKDKEINEEGSTLPQPAPRSSALKLLYILRKVIEKDFNIMESRKPKNQNKKKEKRELIHTIVLEDYRPELLGQLIGFCGRNIMSFMKSKKCHVRFDKIGKDGEEKLKATIKKTTENMSELEKIAAELIAFAKETQETVESYVPSDDEEITPEVLSVYDEVDQMNSTELKEEYKELVEAIDTLNSSTNFQDIGKYYEENPSTRYRAITKKYSLINQIQAFNEVKYALKQPSIPTTTTAKIASLSLGQSSSTAAPKTTASGSQASQTGASSSHSFTRQMSGTSSSSSSLGAGSSTLVRSIDINASEANDPCPTKCLVHDRRWVSTYQYTLTQCYTQIKLPKKQGSRFSRLICTCDKKRPEARLYFVVEDYMVKGFEACKEKIERWPQDCQVIMKPLITQLEKYDKSEIWHSLFKFVFYFNSVEANLMNVLDVGHKLPGECTTYVPRQEKPYMYQASVPVTIVRPGASATLTSSSAGASGTSFSQSGIGASSYQSIFNRSTASTSASTSTSTSAREPPERKRASLKRLCPDDWSDDCYYHGKKKKFVFQCVVNHLHKNAGLPVKLNIPFSMAVCVCNEKIEFKDFYKSDDDCRTDCRTMKIKLAIWRGDSKASIQPYIKLLEEYIETKQITDGFLKLVYHFNQVYRRDLKYYEELHALVKQQRNMKK